ncbi:hypothetical protein BKA82DRAFT_35837 [Pisolithus tinctorius]|uniref:Uncharacterized protein n=1 Tax=Pisolithus tinctorius Marx 270 TaxID=870435 RepID=A0A0C3J7P6_PISTI|nr:hypothetical protein BKA82DRAFT_35837 [Pisolithus tinctorius]KIN93706.1 hypothetical protein M404DRAFT_35837 [Pisolithus tinctorius Marx 270]
MDAQQPQQLNRPNFALPAFQGVVELIAASGNLTQEEAIEALEQHWEQDNPQGEEQQANQAPQGEGQGPPPDNPPCPPAQPPAVENECPPQWMTDPTPPTFDPDTIVSSNLPT